MISVNNKIILEPYKGSNKIRQEVKSGFAKISQKGTLVGLKLLADASIVYGGQEKKLEKGSTLFFEEETLHAHKEYKTIFECEGIEGQFVIGNSAHIRLTHE